MKSCCQSDLHDCRDIRDCRRSSFSRFSRFSRRFPGLERPLVLISSIPRNGQTDVSPSIKAIKLIFGRDFNNDRRLVDAFNEIDMWQGTNKVPIRIRRGIDRIDGHRVTLVIPIDPLLGGVTYKVRIKSFFVDRDGRTSKKCRLIVFTTACR